MQNNRNAWPGLERRPNNNFNIPCGILLTGNRASRKCSPLNRLKWFRGTLIVVSRLSMNVFGCQFDIRWEDKAWNYQTVTRMVHELRPPSGALVALPEMFATGFSMNVDSVAELPEGPTTQFLGRIATENHIWLVAGVVTRQGAEQPGNRSIVFNPQGQRVAEYTKMRPFTPGGEDKHYRAGEHPAMFMWQGVSVALAICYDLRFPELFRAPLALGEQPELFVVIASWPETRATHWVRLLQARAIENQAYVLGVNRTGTDPLYRYPGRSVFINPQGDIVSDAGALPGWVSGKLEINELLRYREGLPFLKDFRSS